jgi:hypothetical protein
MIVLANMRRGNSAHDRRERSMASQTAAFFRHAAVACAAIVGATSFAATADERPYVRVHIDRMPAAKAKQFADARRDWITFVAEKKLFDPWWGTFLEWQGHGFLSLRPFKSLAELERPSPTAPKDEAYRAAVDRYTEQSDEALVFPHTSQIWAVVPELGYQPEQAAVTLFAPCGGTLSIDTVAPMRDEDAYEESWKKVHDALRKVHYPLTHVVYSTRYGDGRMMSFWLAGSAAAFEQAPPLDKAVADALGAAPAAELLTTLRHSITTSDSAALTCRPDLSTARGD